MKLEEIFVDPHDLLLDPNNYRFQDLGDYVRVDPDRLHEEAVQAKARERIRGGDSLNPLKASILKNGFISVERLVVRPYEKVLGKYIVVEGNRRLAAITSILNEHDAGATVDPKILASISKLPVLSAIADTANDLNVFLSSLMGIRHVSGIKQWDGYQRSKLVFDMKKALELPSIEVAERLGMSTHEVNRRFRAFSALAQMQENEDYGEFATPAMYPLFHEAVSVPQIREWLGWDDQHSLFARADELAMFYSLLTPQQGDDETTHPPKLQSHRDVRELKGILLNAEAKTVLLDPHRSFNDSLAAVRKDELSGLWRSQVILAKEVLDDLGIKELKSLTLEDEHLLERLLAVVNERLSDLKLLKS